MTLKTLYEDGLIREGLFISIGPHREPVLTRPQLRQDLPDGAVGLWSIMSWLMAYVGPTFCIELSKGVGDFKASSLALTVLKNAVQREEFVDLYRQHCHSPLADDLAAPKPNTAWNMDVAAIADNAYVMKIYRNLRVFVSLLQIRKSAIKLKADYPNTSRCKSYKRFWNGFGLQRVQSRRRSPFSASDSLTESSAIPVSIRSPSGHVRLRRGGSQR